MGYYIETPLPFNKAEYLHHHHDAELVFNPEDFDFSSDDVLVCVVENPTLGFEAVGIAYDADERNRFLPTKHDQRPRVWLKMKKSVVRKLNPQAPI